MVADCQEGVGVRAYLGHVPDDDAAGGAAADDVARVGAEARARDRARVPQPHVRVYALLVLPQLIYE